MKRIKKILVVLALVLSLCMVSPSAFAATVGNGDISVTLKTDKQTYSDDEPIAVKLKLKNNTDDVLTNISLENIIPDGYELSGTLSSTKQIDVLDGGEQVKLNNIFVAAVASSFVSTPFFGVLMVVLVLIALGVLMFVFRNRLRFKSVLSVFMVVTLLCVAMPQLKVFAADDGKLATVTKKVKVDNKRVTLESDVTYNGERFESSREFIDTDDDGVADYLEDYFGINKNKSDTDGDGLSDYAELFKIKSDPLKKDSNGNFVSDGEEDADNDGVCNADEEKYRTSPVDKDSDSDGLTDGEELNQYNTDLLKKDTDGDGLSDGDEVKLGLNPLIKKTDGKTVDSKRLFNQKLSKNKIDPSLRAKSSAAVPSLSGKVYGLIDKHVSITPEDVDALESNTAVVGTPINIKTDYSNKYKFKLKFDCSLYDSDPGLLLICRYEEGKITPCKTKVNETIVSADVFGGTYFIVNSAAQLKELGVNVEDNLSGNDLKQYKKSAAYSVSADTESQVSGNADIVFIVDSTGSMDKIISNVADNIESFIDTIGGLNVSVNLALIDFKDAVFNEGINIAANGDSYWYVDSEIDTFKAKMKSLSVGGGVDAPESSLDAVVKAQSLNFRNNANKFFILITDSKYRLTASSGTSDISSLADNLAASGIVTSVITTEKLQQTYKPLTEITGGKMLKIDTAFGTTSDGETSDETLDSLADNIGEETVNESEWVVLSDYQCVELESPVSATAATDTDGDGLTDYAELGDKTLINLNPYIEKVLTASGLPSTELQGLSNKGIYVYNYKSNPALPDTDFDGMNDKEDKCPKSSYFTGTLHTDYADSDITTYVDYRWFFDDSNVYNPDLSKLSLLYSSAIYHENYLNLTDTDGTQILNSSNNAENSMPVIMTQLGMSDCHSYFLGDDAVSIGYTKATDAHVSEVALGHRTVTYNGKTKTIISVDVRGTNGTIQEWQSNFDIGEAASFDNASHSDYCTDWKTKLNHKGFDAAANRILNIISLYCTKFNVDTSQACYWVTGHSRGAAIANLIGGYLADQSKDAYTYTFAAPSTTLSTDIKADKYNSIFNVINEDDFVPCLPLEKWGYSRYGKSCSVSLANTSDYEEQWEDMTDILDYNPDTNGMDKTVDALADILVYEGHDYDSVNPEIDCYTYTCTCHGNGESDNITITNRGTSANSRDEAIAKIPENALPYCKIVKKDGTLFWGYDFTCCQTPAYFMQILAAQMGGTINAYRFAVELNIADRYETAKTQIIVSAISGITHPHYTESYYILSNNIIGTVFS